MIIIHKHTLSNQFFRKNLCTELQLPLFFKKQTHFRPIIQHYLILVFQKEIIFYLNALKEKTEVKGFINTIKKEKIKIIPIMGGWAVSSGRIKKKRF